MVAIGLVKGSRKLNRDFAFVGYDNTDLAIASSPELTSVSHPYNDLGKIAIDLMDKDFDEKKYKDIILDPILIQRESTLLKNLKKK
jgi:DNA-binding LacI/PurR family transcriptional regulator